MKFSRILSYGACIRVLCIVAFVGMAAFGQNQTPPNAPPTIAVPGQQSTLTRDEWAQFAGPLVATINAEGRKVIKPDQAFLVKETGDTCQLRLKAVVSIQKELNTNIDPFDYTSRTTARIAEGWLNVGAIEAANIQVTGDAVIIQGKIVQNSQNNQNIFDGNVVHIYKIGKGNLLDLELDCSNGHLKNGHKCSIDPIHWSSYQFTIPDGPTRAREIADYLIHAAGACGRYATNVAPSTQSSVETR